MHRVVEGTVVDGWIVEICEGEEGVVVVLEISLAMLALSRRIPWNSITTTISSKLIPSLKNWGTVFAFFYANVLPSMAVPDSLQVYLKWTMWTPCKINVTRFFKATWLCNSCIAYATRRQMHLLFQPKIRFSYDNSSRKMHDRLSCFYFYISDLN